MSMEAAVIAVSSSYSKGFMLNYSAATLVRVPCPRRNITFHHTQNVRVYEERQPLRWPPRRQVGRVFCAPTSYKFIEINFNPKPEPKPKPKPKPEETITIAKPKPSKSKQEWIHHAINIGVAAVGLAVMATNVSFGVKPGVYKTVTFREEEKPASLWPEFLGYDCEVIQHDEREELIINHMYKEEPRSPATPGLRFRMYETISISRACEQLLNKPIDKASETKPEVAISINDARKFEVITRNCDCTRCVNHGYGLDFLACAKFLVQALVTVYSFSGIYHEYREKNDKENGQGAAEQPN